MGPEEHKGVSGIVLYQRHAHFHILYRLRSTCAVGMIQGDKVNIKKKKMIQHLSMKANQGVHITHHRNINKRVEFKLIGQEHPEKDLRGINSTFLCCMAALP